MELSVFTFYPPGIVCGMGLDVEIPALNHASVLPA